eukprot:393968-Pelagomonas_calceolata.AAC.8
MLERTRYSTAENESAFQQLPKAVIFGCQATSDCSRLVVHVAQYSATTELLPAYLSCQKWLSRHYALPVLQNKMKINDWLSIQSLFDELNRRLDKYQKYQGMAAPRMYIRMLVELDDFLNDTMANKDIKKKMSSTNAKALNAMRQRLKKHIPMFAELVEKYKENPESTDEEEEEDEEEGKEEGKVDEEDRKQVCVYVCVKVGTKGGGASMHCAPAPVNSHHHESRWACCCMRVSHAMRHQQPLRSIFFKAAGVSAAGRGTAPRSCLLLLHVGQRACCCNQLLLALVHTQPHIPPAGHDQEAGQAHDHGPQGDHLRDGAQETDGDCVHPWATWHRQTGTGEHV